MDFPGETGEVTSSLSMKPPGLEFLSPVGEAVCSASASFGEFAELVSNVLPGFGAVWLPLAFFGELSGSLVSTVLATHPMMP